MSSIRPHKFHWFYVWIPLLGAFVWFGTLISLLATWLALGTPQYDSMEGTIAYVSDIGAGSLKPLFVAGSAVTAVCFFLSLTIERWLRHSGRLMPNLRTRERVFGVLAALSSLLGGVGLVLLSIFDTRRYATMHRLFLLIFMVGVVLSALFTIVEYRWLSKEFKDVRELRNAYVAKAVIAIALVALAFAFGVMMFKKPDVGAVLEWVISIGFTAYLVTFYFDLRQSKGIRKGEMHMHNRAASRNQSRTGQV